MYCTKCGRELPQGTKFCTFCGTRVEGMAEGGGPVPGGDSVIEGDGSVPGSGDGSPSGDGPDGPAEEGGFKPGRAKGRGLLAVLAVLAVLVIVVAALLLSGVLGGADGSTDAEDASYTVVYYASDETLRVASSTSIVFYNDAGEALEDYDLILVDEDEEVTTYHVDDGSFTPESAGIPAGSYEGVIRDTEEGEFRTVPAIEVVDEDDEEETLPEEVIIKPEDGEGTGDGEDTGDTEDTEDTPTAQQLAYLLYYQKILEYEELWGEGAITTNEELSTYNESFFSGVCLISLIDFEGDGVEELVIVYLESDSTTWPYLSYVVEVWRYDAEAADIACVCSSPLTDIQNVPMLFLIEGVGMGSGYLLHWGAASPDDRVTFVYTADDGSLSVALYDYDGLTIDGVEVDDETCAAFLDEYLHYSDYGTIWMFEFQTGGLDDEENLLLMSEEVRARILEGAMSFFDRSSEDEEEDLSINLTSDDVYRQYYEKLQELIDEYGEGAAQESDMTGSQWMSGVCFAQLLDFNGDNQDELLVVYCKDSPDETSFSSVYCCEIWGFNETDMSIYVGNFVGDEHCFYLVEIDGRSYLSAFDISDAYSVYGYDDENDRLHELMAFEDWGGPITVNGVYHETYYTMDGEECTQEEYEAAYATYVEAATSYTLCYNEGDFSALDVLAETLAFLEGYAED